MLTKFNKTKFLEAHFCEISEADFSQLNAASLHSRISPPKVPLNFCFDTTQSCCTSLFMRNCSQDENKTKHERNIFCAQKTLQKIEAHFLEWSLGTFSAEIFTCQSTSQTNNYNAANKKILEIVFVIYLQLPFSIFSFHLSCGQIPFGQELI